MLERLKVVLFLNYFPKMFVWTLKLPIGDFGGRGPSPSVLKKKAINSITTAKVLGNLLKES